MTLAEVGETISDIERNRTRFSSTFHYLFRNIQYVVGQTIQPVFLFAATIHQIF